MVERQNEPAVEHNREFDRCRNDREWNRDARGETEVERLDRNWSTLIQELRVVQTGVQFLISALLIVPFQASFATLSPPLRVLYLITLTAAIGATVFLVAPISWHRILFRRHRLGNVVAAAHRCAMIGIGLLGVSLTGAMILVVELVTGTTGGVVAGVVVAVLFLGAWLIVPWWWRSPRDKHNSTDHASDAAAR
ncbi:hypothetical protein NBRGN_052_00330 [Nocardia brasiliensis NBRC 14402]|uniref:DUF6328 family protein n=1 Tax=Nocardia brasiliensis TaxID=37326 RepID=UPI0003075E6A|nr:DUF6328 family protein [Nocardia brasiliensis]ASF06882.1 hypothetical protein CEQ30_05520 [Nocardia brasiliensis]GAJ82245.1 hypothetical protein NBRGN_052_00330 [Nocardia brasiliensis NBRC 14402]SUB47902.1 Uncharacterised protein [Nocardia brasiliensis]